MNMIKSKYVILKAQLSPNYTMEERNSWQNMIVEFIFSYLDNKKCSLFELDPNKNSLIYSYKNFIDVKFNGKKGVFVDNVILNEENIQNLISEQDFYLGNMIIILDEVKDDAINILNSWDFIFETGREIITLKDDGMHLYVYNPSDTLNEQIFQDIF